VVNSVFEKESSPSRLSHSPDGLVTAYRHLCRRGAKKFWRAGLERCDLEQVAAIGLIKAARRYDELQGTPFEAYAWLFVVGELMHYVRDHERAIRLPRRLVGLERRYTRAHEALLTRLGRDPNDAELSAELGVLVPALVELREARQSAAPAPIDETDSDIFPAQGALALEDRIMVDEAFAALSRTERRVIAGIYLLGLTQLELSRRLGVSAKRVSRIHHGALVRMARVCGCAAICPSSPAEQSPAAF